MTTKVNGHLGVDKSSTDSMMTQVISGLPKDTIMNDWIKLSTVSSWAISQTDAKTKVEQFVRAATLRIGQSSDTMILTVGNSGA